MTKKELKEKYTKWNKEISALEDRKKEIWRELQNMNAEKGDGHKWCCMERLIEGLAKTGFVYVAMDIASEYYRIEGQQEALKNLAIATNNFEI